MRFAGVLTAVIFILSVAQLGPVLVMIATVFWVYTIAKLRLPGNSAGRTIWPLLEIVVMWCKIRSYPNITPAVPPCSRERTSAASTRPSKRRATCPGAFMEKVLPHVDTMLHDHKLSIPERGPFIPDRQRPTSAAPARSPC